jgi:predicted nuclease with TOPRIM domain
MFTLASRFPPMTGDEAMECFLEHPELLMLVRMQNQEVAAELEELMARVEELEVERDRVRAEHDRLLAEHNRLLAERNRLRGLI